MPTFLSSLRTARILCYWYWYLTLFQVFEILPFHIDIWRHKTIIGWSKTFFSDKFIGFIATHKFKLSFYFIYVNGNFFILFWYLYISSNCNVAFTPLNLVSYSYIMHNRCFILQLRISTCKVSMIILWKIIIHRDDILQFYHFLFSFKCWCRNWDRYYFICLH